MRASHSAAALILGGSNPALVGTTGLSKDKLQGLKSLTRPKSAGGGPTPRKALSASLKPSSLATFEFRMSTGGHGLEWEGLVVSNVKGQAKQLGVQIGWKIYAVDGVMVRDGKEAWELLQDAQWQWRACNVVFVTDFRAIRAEQKMIAAHEAAAEVERLAKLPFSNNYDEKHLAQLKQEFTFQGYIEDVEDRGITLAQLQRMTNFSKDRCHRWRDAASPLVSRTSGRKLHLDFMNWCHLYDWLITPPCKAKGCSFVEMLTSQKQTPAFYLLHWWGDLVTNTMAIMKTHLEMRKLDESTPYWIASCACRPHSTQEDKILHDPTKTCFYKAMAACNNKIMVAIDAKTEYNGVANLLTRTWCVYELSVCLNLPNPQLDIVQASSPGVKASMVTQYLIDEEKDAEIRAVTTGYKAKADREKAFSLQIMEMGLNVQINMTQTSDPLERRRILNAIAQRELGEEPLEKHENYVTVNKRMHSLFALAFWRRTMSGAVSDTEMQRVQSKLIEALRNDTRLTSLDLDMAFMQGGWEKIKMLTGNAGLSPTLTELKLDLRETELVNENMVQLATGLPRDLEDLIMDLSGNEPIHNAGVEAFIAKAPSKLRGLQLELKKTSVGKELQAKQSSLSGMKEQIAYEAAKADRCTIFNLNPSPTRHMVMTVTKTKLAPPPEDK
mmetsp:Transcript_44558/g.80075  ORF Transcript_44558/g.80075 Transcript_44558/m.80075 type:complete len:668 (-) Transcript_44558:58-2061(-)|eukprot:CAMPEP_0197648164 /NCGR_PEP_ID=MMETSP1338-20131121/27586_1 /TAXON_ID=43686 ORGANISM="Pelagodinium beii, Strain RCC1491" /NCGR_SAMPLE_ID=MMETSP1338 /ASSEMBLY_ACC=CAM_ASM_000754 /LENGTH=667 /DNA_ID=CAMNT_0043222113 /DNA_START=71 /DNA_END=2074 /DNA_ORIENTATION=+